MAGEGAGSQRFLPGLTSPAFTPVHSWVGPAMLSACEINIYRWRFSTENWCMTNAPTVDRKWYNDSLKTSLRFPPPIDSANRECFASDCSTWRSSIIAGAVVFEDKRISCNNSNNHKTSITPISLRNSAVRIAVCVSIMQPDLQDTNWLNKSFPYSYPRLNFITLWSSSATKDEHCYYILK